MKKYIIQAINRDGSIEEEITFEDPILSKEIRNALTILFRYTNLNLDTKKLKLIDRLRDLYNDNELSEKDELTILDTLTYLGFDIKMI